MRGGPDTLVVADRGASADAPEHTIAAYELALAQGADALLLDLHASHDLEPVVIHDFTLERTTDGAGPVADRTLRDLKRLDAGAAWRDGRFAGQRVQALHEVLERFRSRARFLMVLRGGRACYPTLAERVVSLTEIYEVVDRTLVASFDPDALAEARALNAEVAVGLLVPPDRAGLPDRPAPSGGPPLPGIAPVPDGSPLPGGAGVSALCVDASTLTEAVVTRVRAAGLSCYAWVLGEPGPVERLAAWGTRGIITGRPGSVVARLGR
jgi:glycerophosphoryl diester phosphodiesterase